MADLFLALSKDDRREVLAVAADRTGRPIHLLEKDVWVFEPAVAGLNYRLGSR